MTEVLSNLFIDVHLSKAKLPLFLDCHCYCIASTVSEYCLRQMLLGVLVDSSTNLLCNDLYDYGSLRIDMAFGGICTKTNPNIRYRFQMPC